MRVHVDDTSFIASAESFDGVLEKLVNAEDLYAKKVARLNLRLSPKRAAVASHHKLTMQLTKEIKQFGVKLVVAKHTRDVGVTFTAAAGKHSKLLSSRLKNRNKI